MSDNNPFGFGKFVPGFDFLQGLAKGASQSMPQLPSLANWVAPTLNVEELDKRIGELKAVHFWLDQNSKALSATIQALEVQKMTLATLKGMNFNMSEVANALKLKGAEAMASASKPAERQAESAAAKDSTSAQDKAASKPPAEGETPPTAMVDPMQWWGALTQQFQEIATNAMKDAAGKSALDAARNMATDMATQTMKAAADVTGAASSRQPATKSAPAKAAKPKRTTTARKRTSG